MGEVQELSPKILSGATLFKRTNLFSPKTLTIPFFYSIFGRIYIKKLIINIYVIDWKMILQTNDLMKD